MKKVLLMFAFIATLLVGSIGTAGAQVNYTVYDGTNTSTYVPVEGLYTDSRLKCEYVIPADHLTAINGSTISKLTYYLTSSATAAWTCNFQVFVKEVASSTISSFSGMEDATLVYEGTLDATSSTMEVVFSTPYTYNGGNLLIGFYNTNTGNWKGATFAGQNIQNSCVQGHNSNFSSITATQKNFIPKTTFTVDELHGCLTPTNLAVSDITTNGATVTWTPGNTETDWVVKFNDDEYSVSGTPSYTVAGLTPNTSYVASVKAVCGGTEESEYTTPGVLFTTLPTCPAPTAVTVSNITTTSADIAWTNGGEETAWTIDYNGTEIAANSNPFTLTGLNPSTNYTVKVKANCDADDESAWSATAEFRTACGTVVVDDMNSMVEGFEGNDLGCWTSEIIAGTYNWTIYTSYPHSGNHSVYFDYGGLQARLISPVMDLTGITTQPRLSFYHRQSSWYGSVDAMDVYYRTAADADWTFLANYSTEYAVMSYDELILPNPTATYQIAFVSNADDNYGIYLDDITVDAAPSCLKPTAVTVSNVTAHTADIAWTNGGTETAWTIDYNGTEIAADSNPFTLTGLNAATSYTVKVKANCSEENESEWSTIVSFTTPCEAMTITDENPYTEDFNAYTGVATYITGTTVLPNCWDFTYTGTDISYTPKLVNSSSYGTSNMIVLTSGGTSASNHNSYGQHTYAYLPEIANDMDELQWQFDYSTNVYSAPAECEMAVGYVTDIADPTTFVVMEEYPYVANNVWNTLTINLVNYNVPANARLAIRWSEAANGYYCFIDNVVVRMLPSCLIPTDVAVTNVTAYTADIAWTAAEETEWVLSVNGEESVITENPYTLTGLTPVTNYSIALRAICSATDTSEWSNTVAFTTTVSCPAPTAVTVSNITENTADIAWTNGGDENAWIIDLNGSEITATTNPYSLTGLDAATSYTVKVKANCSDDDESDWSTEVSFATPCEAVVVTETSPFTEDFNTLTSGIPNCWDNAEGTTTNSSYKWSYYSTGVTGSCVRFNSFFNSNGNYNLLKTPVLDLTAVTLPVLSFTHKNPSAAGGFEVMYTTDGGATYMTIATGLQGAGAWTTEEIPVSALANNANVMFVFKGTSNYGSGDDYIYLDDVMVYETPTCPKPTAVTVSNITETTADIAWTNGGTETAWTIDYNGTEIAADSNPFTLTNLTNSTLYTVKVKANCSDDDESDWSTEVSFRTECGTIVVTDGNPFLEGFEGPDFGCWTTEQVAGTANWELSTSYASEGNKSAKFPWTTNAEGRLISPILDLTQLTNSFVKFGHNQPVFNGAADELHLYYRASASDDWTLLQSFTTPTTGFAEEEIALPNPSATYQICFHGKGLDKLAIYVDNVFVGTYIPCLTPTAVVVSNETETSADVDWTAGNQETAWNIRYRPASNSVFFDFEDGMQGWTAYDVDGDTYNWMHEDCAETPHMTPYEGTGCAYSESYYNDDYLPLTPDNWLISPEVELIGSVKFMAVGQDASYAAEHFAVYVIEGAMPATIDSTTISAFTQVGTEQIATGEYTEYTFDLSGHTGMGHVAIRHFNCTNQFVLVIDNVTIGEAPAEWTVVEGVTNPYTIEGLTANTTYEVQVQAACSEDETSDWTASVEFTTLAADTTVEEPCATPANIAVENNVVTWESEAANFNIMIVANGDTTHATAAGNTYTVEGLENGTEVVVLVQAICDEDNLSDWTEGFTFTYETTGINNYSINVKVYPNPTTGIINVDCAAINADVTVYDMFGKLMMTSKIANERTELDFSAFAPGMYIVRIADANNSTNVKVVKE